MHTSPRKLRHEASSRLRRSTRHLVAWTVVAAALPGSASHAQTPPTTARWTAATPDQMADHLLARARRGGEDALAALVLAASLDERASFGHVRDGLAAVAASSSPLADDARWLRLRLLPSPPAAPWPGMRAVSFDAPPDPDGLVKALALLGPFQDTGGGLMRREGPEAGGESWTSMDGRYAWGVYDVAWRRVLPASVTPRGVPLDLYIHPRAESCTYLASRIAVPAGTRPFVVHLASTGAVRLLWDGADVAASDQVLSQMVLDRMAARVEPDAGDHLLAVKVCSAAVGDEGRVRLRITDEQNKPMPLATSSDLRGLGSPRRATAPRGVTPVPTALSKALAVGDSPTPEQALAAAVLRTVGSADDAASPRAPGLLDRAARAPETTPDQLALAGWISPFGANRSGWLNLARVRAGAAHDTATAAFAQRRLVAAHLGSRHIDWAITTAAEEPLSSAGDAEARLIKALIKKRLGAGGFGRAAVEDLQGIASALKEDAPLSVLTEMYGLTRLQGPLHLALARRLEQAQADARGVDHVDAWRVEGAAAMERRVAEVLAQQTSADAVLNLGRALLDHGRAAWAREVFYVATQLAPNRSAGFAGLAAARQALSDDPAQIKAALARARALEPGDAGLKAELAFRSDATPEGAPARAAMRDEEHLVKPEVFLARAKRRPAKKGEVFDRQLHWIRVVTYHPDKRVSQLMQVAREIVVEPRTEQDRYEGLPNEGDEAELLFARVHRKDGAVAQPEEQSSGGRRPFIRWPELKAGDVVEYAVRAWTSRPVGRRGDAPFWFIDYVGSTDTHPVLYNEVVVDSPEGQPLAVDVLHGKPDRLERAAKDGRVVTRYAWDEPPSVRDEPLAPKLSESLPVVVGSTFGSWADFREWYRAAVKGFTEPDDQVRRLAADLTRDKKTRDEKLRAVFEFVADDIRYVNYVSGEWWLPNRPQELLARRQGDCDDKAMLLITLLRAIGIEATEVLVQTRYTQQPSLLRAERAAIPLFDHGIAYLPGEKGEPGVWLDATSPESRLGPLPSMDARTVAFFIDEGPAKVVDTPGSSPDEHGVDAAWTIKLSPSGAGDLIAEERHSGDAAFELRMNLKQPDARAQWVESYLASGFFPTVQVKGDIEVKTDLPRGVALLKYGARSEGLARREGRELAVPLAESSTLTSQLAPLTTRTLPVVLPPRLAPGHETRTITIVAPSGYQFAELPPNGDVAGGEFGKARVEYKRAAGKNAVVVKRSVVFDLDTIPVDKYAKWRAWLSRVDGLMHRTVRLVPDERAAARRR